MKEMRKGCGGAAKCGNEATFFAVNVKHRRRNAVETIRGFSLGLVIIRNLKHFTCACLES
jgi:hypothetical protein